MFKVFFRHLLTRRIVLSKTVFSIARSTLRMYSVMPTSNHQYFTCFGTVIIRCTKAFWSPCIKQNRFVFKGFRKIKSVFQIFSMVSLSHPAWYELRVMFLKETKSRISFCYLLYPSHTSSLWKSSYLSAPSKQMPHFGSWKYVMHPNKTTNKLPYINL
jgi:hypothetical protein